MLSTTRSSAVWLLRTESFGLESTRTFPKDSSNWRIPVIFPRDALRVKILGNPGVLGRRLSTASRQNLVGLVQDIFDVLFQGDPELVVGSIADRGAGGVAAARPASGSAPSGGRAARPDLRRDADRPGCVALHV